MIATILIAGLLHATAPATSEPSAWIVAALDPVCRAPTAVGAPTEPPLTTAAVAVGAAPTVTGLDVDHLSVASNGAPVGAVLAAIGTVMKKQVLVRARAATVPVWVAVRSATTHDALRATALAAGLVVLEHQQGFVVFDLDAAEAWLLAQAQARESAVTTTVRLIPTGDPVSAAEAAARLVLTCHGRALALPESGMVVIEDLRTELDVEEQAVALFDTEAARSSAAVSARASSPLHFSAAPSCHSAPGGASEGARVVGRALVEQAVAAGEDIAVGCLHELVSFASPGRPQSGHSVEGLVQRSEPAAGAASGRLAKALTPPSTVHVFTRADVASAQQARRAAPTKSSVAVWRVRHPAEAAAAIQFLGLRAVALRGAVAARVSADERERIDGLVVQLEAPKPASAATDME